MPKEVICPHCKEPIGFLPNEDGTDLFDLAKAHLSSCNSSTAKMAREALDEDPEGAEELLEHARGVTNCIVIEITPRMAARIREEREELDEYPHDCRGSMEGEE